MPIIHKDDIAPERPVVIVIYGSPGSGKTSIATTSENPLIIDSDRGYDRAVQRVDTLCANEWTEVINSVSEFKNYKTIICDTAKAMLDDFLSEYVCRMDGRLRTNTLKRFGRMGEEFKTFVATLRSNGSDIVFICHDKETAEGDIIKHSPDCTGQSKDLLLRIADQVGYVSVINGKRHISFEPTDNYIGKNVAQIPGTEIPDATSPEFSTFMADIIRKVKSSIQSKSEAQRKANEMLTRLRANLDMVDSEDMAATLLQECKNLPQIMKVPFFKEITGVLLSRGFSYDKENAKFRLSQDTESCKKIKKQTKATNDAENKTSD